MRSRFTAYAVGAVDHLFRTWHPRTRPAGLTVDSSLTWTGLEVTLAVDGGVGDETGEVAFRASFTSPSGTGVLAERSRFVRRAGRWVYLDGVVGP